jgi:hypothetical protein
MTPLVVLKEAEEPSLTIPPRAGGDVLEEPPSHATEPQLGSIEPRSIGPRGIRHRDLLLAWIYQGSALLPAHVQLRRRDRDSAKFCRPAAENRAPMCIEIVHNPVRAREPRESARDAFRVHLKVDGGPGCHRTADQFTGRHIERGDQGPCRLADVVLLARGGLAGPGWLYGMGAVQRLRDRLLIGAGHRPTPPAHRTWLDVEPSNHPGLGTQVDIMAVEAERAALRIDFGWILGDPSPRAADGPDVGGLMDVGGRKAIASAPSGRIPLGRRGCGPGPSHRAVTRGERCDGRAGPPSASKPTKPRARRRFRRIATMWRSPLDSAAIRSLRAGLCRRLGGSVGREQ